MVNEGKPSRGCAVCRKRKIKCDEKFPACSYCLRRNIVCPGYKPQFDLAWRDQNVVAEQSVRRRKQAEERALRLAKQGQGLVVSRSPSRSLSLSPIISQDLEEYAINFFMSSYVCLPRNSGDPRGFLECLYPAWSQASKDSPLVPAVTAVSSMMLEAWTQILPDQPLSISRRKFVEAIEALRKSIREGRKVTDEVLLAAMMLHMYENMRSFFFPSMKIENPHLDGLSALVKNLREFPAASDVSRGVLLEASHQVVNKALRSKESVPPGIELWTYDTPRTPGELLDSIKLDVAVLLAKIQCDAHVAEPDTLSQLDELEHLDQQLLQWVANIPSDWAPNQVSDPECIPKTVREAGLYAEHCLVYKSMFVAEIFLSYFAARIKIHSAMLTYSQHLPHSDATISLHTIQDLADRVCNSVPFLLGDRTQPGRVDDKNANYPHMEGEEVSDDHRLVAASYGHFIIGPLAGLMGLGFALRQGQLQWIGGQLGRIRRVYGVQPT